MKPIEVSHPHIEEEFIKVEQMPKHPPKRLSKEEKKELLRKEFKSYIKREITEEELNRYMYLFERGLTNFWSYGNTLKGKDNVPKVQEPSNTGN